MNWLKIFLIIILLIGIYYMLKKSLPSNCIYIKNPIDNTDLIWEGTQFTYDNWPGPTYSINEKKIIFEMAKNNKHKYGIIDVGAHIGDLSIPLAKALENSGRSDIVVYAIDPSKDKCDFISRMASYNNISNIKVINKGLSDKTHMQSYINNVNTVNTGMMKWGIKDTNSMMTKFTSLDNMFANNEIGLIGLYHIDVEGHELAVLNGSKHIIQKSQPVITIERYIDNKRKCNINSKENSCKQLFDFFSTLKSPYIFSGYMPNDDLIFRPDDGDNLPYINDKIDVVYTWVDSTDLNWQQQKSYYYQKKGDNDDIRFPDVEYTDIELEFSLLQLFKHAPWVNNVYIVTHDNQIPKCIIYNNKLSEYNNIKIIHHSQIWPSEQLDSLPVFNSHAIEANLHRIPNLTEKFLYFNDDVYLTKDLSKKDCFFNNYILLQRMSKISNRNSNIFKKVWKNMNKQYAPMKMLWHGFHPLTKTSMYKAENHVKSHWTSTIRSRFRDETDISPIGFTHNYALKNNMAYKSFNQLLLLEVHNGKLFTGPLKTDYDVICLNAVTDMNKSISNLKSLLLEK